MSATPCHIPWCKYTAEHHAEYDSHPDEDGILHASGSVGQFELWQYERNPRYPEATATLAAGLSNSDDLTADDLRQLAADALAAIEWMATNAPTPIGALPK